MHDLRILSHWYTTSIGTCMECLKSAAILSDFGYFYVVGGRFVALLRKEMAGEQSSLQGPCAYTEIKVDLAGYKSSRWVMNRSSWDIKS